MNNDFSNKPENQEKSSHGFLKGLGVFVLSLLLATLTVVVINL